MTCREIAERYGVPLDFVRGATKRSRTRHPLPHVTSGEKRKVVRISDEAFEAWIKEEMTR